eukprot:Skav204991  [mRNA]  locus=scaffold1180:845408:849451:- [translate_table: standard]
MDEGGTLLARILALAKIFRPRYLLLENVRGMVYHHDLTLVRKIALWAGYQILHDSLLDAQAILPTERSRFLQVLQRAEDVTQPLRWQSWGTFPPSSPHSWDSLFAFNEEQREEWTPTHATLLKYWDPQFLKTEQQRMQPTKTRIPSPTGKFPTLMAMYGSQHHIATTSLQEKGLQGFFIEQDRMCRWMTPIEAALIHLQPHDLALLKPETHAWRSLGNMICIPHALILLCNMATHEHSTWNQTHVQQIFQKVLAKRFAVSTVVTAEDEHAWYVGSMDGIATLQSKLQDVHRLMGIETPQSHMQDHFYHATRGLLTFEQHAHQHRSEASTDYLVTPTAPIRQDEEQAQHPTDHTHEDAPDETATKRQCIRLDHSAFVRVQVVTQERHVIGILFVSNTLSWMDVVMAWHVQLIPYDTHGHRLDPQATVTPANLLVTDDSADHQHIPDQAFSKSMLWFDHEGYTHVAEATGTWQQMVHRIPELLKQWQDVYGFVYDEQQFQGVVKLIQDNRVVKLPMFTQCQAILDQVRLEARIVPGTDTLQIMIFTEQSNMERVLSLWFWALTPGWLLQYGRSLKLGPAEHGMCQIFLETATMTNVYPFPANRMKEVISVRLMQVAIWSMNDSQVPTTYVFKIRNRVIQPVGLPGNTTVQTLTALFRHCMYMLHYGDQPSLIHAGTILPQETTCQDLIQTAVIGTTPPVVLHVVPPTVARDRSMHQFSGQRIGEASHPGPSGAISEQQRTLHSELATFFLAAGIELPQVQQQVSKLVQQLGVPRLVHFQHAPAQEKQRTFREMCQTCDIRLPDKPSEHKHTSKTQKISKAEHMTSQDIKQYRLQDGFFGLENGNAAPVHQTFSPCLVGITMMMWDEAMAWVDSTTVLPDEIAVFIVGTVPDDKKHRVQSITAPATNPQGHQVILKGSLLQLGEKKIQTPQKIDKAIHTKEVMICAVTLWVDEFTPSQWTDIVTSPVKQTKLLLAADQLDDVIGVPWGRTFKAGKKTVKPDQSTSLQFHCEVALDALPRMLMRSGFNRVYVTPKDPSGQPAAKWRIIWTDLTKDHLQPKVAMLPGSAGFIRGLKSSGLRVDADAFNQIWEILHQGVPPPQPRPTGSLFKIYPYPFGTDKSIIEKWAATYNWKCTPIKLLGPRTWLISSDQQLPNQVLTFNGNPLITKHVENRDKQKNTVVVAGPRHRPGPAQQPEQTVSNARDSSDAWAAFRKTNGMPLNGINTPPSTSASSSVGPTSQHLQLQDTKISSMEAALVKMQQNLEQTMQTQNQRIQQVEHQVTSTQQKTTELLQSLRGDFDNSLARAMAVQDQRIASSFEELKGLFLRGSKRSAPKAAADPSDAELTDEDLG